jgi:hypothetical protein
MLFKNSVRTSKRTPHFTITKINWLMLFKEIIAVYTENHTKHINSKCSVTVREGKRYMYLPLGLKVLTGLLTDLVGPVLKVLELCSLSSGPLSEN